MDKAYQQISYLFFALLVITLIGFFPTYLILFPDFTGTVSAHHFHGFVLLLWIGLLITQPLLIKFKKPEIHRLLGKASYVLVLLMALSILIVTEVQYQRNVAQGTPAELNYFFMYMSVVDLVPFLTLYLLAMWYQKMPAVHMRYIIACSVIFFNPAFGRINIIFFGMEVVPAVLVSYVFCDLILLGFLVYDLIKSKLYQPYLYALIFLVICHTSLLYIPYSHFWQTTAEAIARNFF
jgi:hypothetical protein